MDLPKPRVLLVCRLLCVATFAAIGAQAAPPTLAGQWSATAMRITWTIGDWGSACGPRPSEKAPGGGVAMVSEKGGELLFRESGRAYTTAQCWEQYPGLSVVSHGGGSRGWRTVCKTAANDSRQATITTTLNASDTDIVFDEAGQYQFVVEGQNCTASVRRSRSFHLIQREGEPSAAPAPSVPPSATATAEASASPMTRESPPPNPAVERCREPGPPARLEVRPSRKLMRPGEEFQFRSLVLDGKRCVLNVALSWAVAGQRSELKLLGAGKVRVTDSAAEGEVPITATVEGQSARVVVEIASRERYEAMLNTGRFDRAGETSEVSVAVIASGSIGARTASEGSASARRRLFLAVLGVLLLLGTAGIVAAFRTRRGSRAAPQARSAVAEFPSPRPQAMRCPTCNLEYPAETEFCPADGDRLLAQDSLGDLDQAALGKAGGEATAEMGKKICPMCGVQYPGGAQFCGTDGAHLVPLN
jgi:hypothetical protein